MAVTKGRNVIRQQAVDSIKEDAPKIVAETVVPRQNEVLFISKGEEKLRFDITVAGNRITPFWDDKRKHLIWSVPTALAERFALHEFIVKGRIVKGK